MTIRDVLKIFNSLEYKFYYNEFVKLNNTVGYKIKTIRAISFYYDFKNSAASENKEYEKELFLENARKEVPYKIIYLNKDYLFYKETKYLNKLISSALDMSVERCSLFYFKHSNFFRGISSIFDLDRSLYSEIKSEVDEEFVQKWINLLTNSIKKYTSNTEVNKLLLPLEEHYYKSDKTNMYEVKESSLTMRTELFNDKNIPNNEELYNLLKNDFNYIENLNFIFSFKRAYYAFDIF